MFGHRNGFGEFQTYTGVPGGYRNPSGSVMGLLGLSGDEEGRLGQAARPLPSIRIGPGEGGGAPLPSLPLSLPSPPFPPGGILLGLGVLVGLPSPGAPYRGRPASPSPPLYTGAGGCWGT